MYAKNTIARRRPSGWVERRRYFQRLFERLRVKEHVRVKALKDEENQKVAPVLEKG